jgi:hypothetical protein
LTETGSVATTVSAAPPRERLHRTRGYTSDNTSKRGAIHPEPKGEAIGDVFRGSSSTSHSVWGRVVPDIPAFCRELIAALAEE